METSQELDVVTRRCARLSWRLAAQLEADRMRAVRMGFACLEALPLPTMRTRHGQSSARDGTAIRRRARLAKFA